MTELCDGTLHDLIKDSSNFDLIKIVHQIVSGLVHLQEKRIIHRDLKPQNILYILSTSEDAGPVMKLADFGMSRIIPEDKSHLTRTLGTEGHSENYRPFGTDGWIAPEFLHGESKYSYSGDIYPLGLIFAFTLSGGLHPFGEDAKTRNEAIRNGKTMLSDVENELKKRYNDGCCQLIESMLNSNAAERPTAGKILQNKFFFVDADEAVSLSFAQLSIKMDDQVRIIDDNLIIIVKIKYSFDNP